MPISTAVRRLSPFAITAALALGVAAPVPAHACAVLPESGARTAPDLSTERVLIIYDRRTETEHFLREVRFHSVSSRFAFLVPTPTQPELAKLETSPFDALHEKYPFRQPEEPPSQSIFSVSKSAPARAAVEVHEVKQIGSFTAFVLTATDAVALEKWFVENNIARPQNALQWLQHLIDLKFFITAFRFEPSAPAVDSETVRLTFKTKEAYYPYAEPFRDAEPEHRELAVWTISPEKLVPAALFAPKVGSVRWNIAWMSGLEHEAGADVIGANVPGLLPLLPKDGTLQIQTFIDTRDNRNGVSDIVLAKDGDSPSDGGFRSRATALLGSLEKLPHTGVHDFSMDGGELSAFHVKPLNRGCACSVAGGAGDGALIGCSAMAMAVGALFGRRRRAGARDRR